MGEPKYFGLYRGFVKDNADPKRLGRVRCHVPEILGHEHVTDWASPVLPWGAVGGTGLIVPPVLDSKIWVAFEAGVIDRPMYTGGWAAEPGGTSEIPALAQGTADESAQAPKGADSTAIPSGPTIAEPPIPFAAVYPHNIVLKTKQGIVIEIDSTPGKERVHLWHPQKSWLEFHPDGTIVMRAAGQRYVIVEGGDTLHVKGAWNVKAEGDINVYAGGNARVDAVGEVVLGAPGGPQVARTSDVVEVIVSGGSSAGVHYGKIITGSAKVRAE